MRKAFTLLLLLSSIATQAQWYTGWSAQTGLALCLHLTDSMPQLYSPMQSAEPLPVSQSSWRGDTLHIQCATIGFSTTLVRTGNAFRGTWKQGVMREAIVFEPADTLYTMRRPQTPTRPYAFCEDTVAVDYVDSQGNSVHLEGTLTYPCARGKYPTVVLVSGSGLQNRDEEIMYHKPFLVLADYLAAHGIAVLRYDDRGVGSSRGRTDSADTYLYAEDAEAMLKTVKANKHVDAKRLGIGGHSEGAAIAGIVASRCNVARFVVMLAGQGCAGADVLLQQNAAILQSQGVSDSLVEIRVACMREVMALAPNARIADYKNVLRRYTQGLTDTQTDSISLRQAEAYNLRTQMQSAWMQGFMRLEPADYLPKVQCPVLALWGEKDCQVVPEPNARRVAELSHHKATCRVLPSLNHLFQHCNTGSPQEYVRIDESFAPEAMAAVAEWILNLQR